MPINLGQFTRPRTVSIFASDPATLGGIVVFILQDIAIPVPNRVRLDLTHGVSGGRRVSASRSPVEPGVVDNIRREPESVTVRGQLSATPLGPVASRLGGFGSLLRRDLRELDKLRAIQARDEPVVLVTPARVYPSMAMSIAEEHGGDNKVELTLQFEEITILTPIAVSGVLDLDALVAGAGSTTNAGAQGTTVVTAPAGVAGGVGG